MIPWSACFDTLLLSECFFRARRSQRHNNKGGSLTFPCTRCDIAQRDARVQEHNVQTAQHQTFSANLRGTPTHPTEQAHSKQSLLRGNWTLHWSTVCMIALSTCLVQQGLICLCFYSWTVTHRLIHNHHNAKCFPFSLHWTDVLELMENWNSIENRMLMSSFLLSCPCVNLTSCIHKLNVFCSFYLLKLWYEKNQGCRFLTVHRQGGTSWHKLLNSEAACSSVLLP